MIRADYDSEANAIAIKLVDAARAEHSDPIGDPLAAVVAVAEGQAIEIQILHPEVGLEDPLRTAAKRYGLDSEALLAAAQAALAAPDRTVTVDIAVRATA